MTSLPPPPLPPPPPPTPQTIPSAETPILPPLPPLRAATAPQSASTLVSTATILLGLGALAQVWFAAAVTVRRHSALRFLEGRGGLGAIKTGDHLVQSAAIARYGLMIPTAIVLAMWSARVVRTNFWLGRRDPTITPALAAGCWFLPIVNLILPALVVTNVWKASDPTLPSCATWAHARDRSSTPLIASWWGCWLGSLVIQVLFGATTKVTSSDSARQYRDHLDRQVLLAGIGVLLTVTAAVLGAIVVSKLAERQRVSVELRLQGA